MFLHTVEEAMKKLAKEQPDDFVVVQMVGKSVTEKELEQMDIEVIRKYALNIGLCNREVRIAKKADLIVHIATRIKFINQANIKPQKIITEEMARKMVNLFFLEHLPEFDQGKGIDREIVFEGMSAAELKNVAEHLGIETKPFSRYIVETQIKDKLRERMFDREEGSNIIRMKEKKSPFINNGSGTGEPK